MTDANSWREPLRSVESTEAQGLTAAWQVSTKILQVFGNFILLSSVRHSVEASSASREPHLIPPHYCGLLLVMWRQLVLNELDGNAARGGSRIDKRIHIGLAKILLC